MKNRSCSSGNRNITGCRVGIYPMTDSYVSIIMEAIAASKTDSVWNATDALGTLYRGEQNAVVEAVHNLVKHAYRENVHMTTRLTFSRGCPGDSDADAYMSDGEISIKPLLNRSDAYVEAIISFYVFGDDAYMSHIEAVIEMLKERNVYATKSHYATTMAGTLSDIFDAFNAILEYGNQHLDHYVIESVLSFNSPTEDNNETI